MKTATALSLAAAALLTTAACGSGGSSGSGDSGGSTSKSSSSGGGVTSAKKSTPKPCTLVTLKDADAATGLSFKTTANDQDTGVTLVCDYNDDKGHRVEVAVGETSETTQQLDTIYSHGAVKVAGVGDGAYWNNSQSTIYVTAHGVPFSVAVFDDHLTMPDSQQKADATTLAKTAVGRL